MRIVTVDPNKCRPKKCGHECFKYCPIVKSGDPEIIDIEERSVIDEELCIGCGICVKVCPFEAISVVNLPEAVGNEVHRYGQNLFALFGLPTPGESVGILGPNGTGKTTMLRIFSGQLIPNLGEGEGDWPSVIDRFSGTEVGGFLKSVSEGDIRISYKPQKITLMPKQIKGKVRTLLEGVDERGKLGEIIKRLDLTFMDKEISQLSGGELQKTAIAATLAKDADVYFFDEPGSFLDIYERLRVSRVIRDFTERVFVVEHDLVMLDYLSKNLHIAYGKPGSYGAVSMRKPVRTGINQFLEGYLQAENIRIRESPLEFSDSSSRTGSGELVSFSELSVDLGSFQLKVQPGNIREEEIVGVVGRNALGKTTLMRVLAGDLEPESGSVSKDLKVSYKPQYVKAPEESVRKLFSGIDSPSALNRDRDVFAPLSLTHLLDRRVDHLSGGELQRVSIGLCLAQDADLYLLDEPSAFLDSEQRLRVAKLLRRLMQNLGRSAVVVEHDLMFLDYLSDRLLVFVGEPGKRGETLGPMDTDAGMNRFLESVDITLRRDPDSKRPRVNKPGSQKDREQRSKEKFYAST